MEKENSIEELKRKIAFEEGYMEGYKAASEKIIEIMKSLNLQTESDS